MLRHIARTQEALLFNKLNCTAPEMSKEIQN